MTLFGFGEPSSIAGSGFAEDTGWFCAQRGDMRNSVKGEPGRMQVRSGKNQAAPIIDDLDASIIELLRANGRATNQEIAEKLSVTAATVSARLRRMEEARVMRVVAVTDFSAHDYNVLIALGAKVRGRDVQAVGRDLASLPEVLSVNIMTGSHEIELLVALHDFTEINMLLSEHIAAIDGVWEVSPGIAADIVKFEFNVVPL
jgi:Lrp/AsnC family transcriptional regulator for asnA, asnC and gidA